MPLACAIGAANLFKEMLRLVANGRTQNQDNASARQ